MPEYIRDAFDYSSKLENKLSELEKKYNTQAEKIKGFQFTTNRFLKKNLGRIEKLELNHSGVISAGQRLSERIEKLEKDKDGEKSVVREGNALRGGSKQSINTDSTPSKPCESCEEYDICVYEFKDICDYCPNRLDIPYPGKDPIPSKESCKTCLYKDNFGGNTCGACKPNSAQSRYKTIDLIPSKCDHQWDEIEPIECIICGVHKEKDGEKEPTDKEDADERKE